MRVLKSRGKPAGDRGAVLVIFAVFSLVAVLFMAFVVDFGNSRQEEREVTLSTDAAALAAAQSVDVVHLVDNPNPPERPCSSVPSTDGGTVDDTVREYLSLNGGSALEECLVHWDLATNTGWVSVDASELVEYAFEGVTGRDGGRVRGATAATFGATVIPAVLPRPPIPPTPPTPGTPPYSGGGLRPLGVCFEEVQAGLGAALPTTTRSLQQADGTYKSLSIDLEKLQKSNACPEEKQNSGAGNIGLVDFDGGSNPNGGSNCEEGTQCGWVKSGYFGPVEPLSEGDPGADLTKHQASWWAKLRDDQTLFLVPVYDYVQGTGGNTKLRITHYVEVRLTAFSADSKRFTLELRIAHPYTRTPPSTSDATPGTPGTPGNPGDPGDPGSPRQVNRQPGSRICSVDDSAGECAP